MRLSVLAAMALLAACQQTSENQAANELADAAANTAPETASAAPAAKPLSREAALKLMHDRHENMEDIGDATKAVGRALKSDSPDLAVIRDAAAVYSRHARQIPDWFPAGTGPDVGETHAKPAIWEKPEDFAAKSRDFDGAAEAFRVAASDGDVAAIRARFADLGKTCKACHDPYRAKDD